MIAERRPRRSPGPRSPAGNPASSPVGSSQEGQRLSKCVMALKGCSRRDAEQFIEGGWVSVNGQVIEEPMFRVTNQGVEVDPHASLLELATVTLLLHKPPGFDAMALPGAGNTRVKPAHQLLKVATHAVEDAAGVGVLNRHFAKLAACVPLETAASGLVVFTQDWRVVRKLGEDAALIEHEFMVEVKGPVSPDALNKLNHSGKRDDQAVPPVKASVNSDSDASTRLRFAIKGSHPGLIAWLCERADLQITGMKRIRIGRVGMGPLPVGQWRYMQAHERF